MKILLILQYVPYPLDSGGNQAMFNMIEELRKVHDISILLKVDNDTDSYNVHKLKDLWSGVTFYLYREDTSKIKINNISYRILNYFQKSFTRKVNRRIRKFEKQNRKEFINNNDRHIRDCSCLFNDFIIFSDGYGEFVYNVSRKGFDLIQVEFFELLPLIYYLPENTINVFVHHEIRFIRTENVLNLLQNKTPKDFFQYKMLKDLEFDALSRYDNIIVLTEVDKQILLKEDPNLDVYVSPAIVKSSQNKNLQFSKPSNELVFIGSGFHFPNFDGLLWFCKEVMQYLQGYNIKLNVVGKWSKEHQKQIENVCPMVNFTGFVDDLSAYICEKISIVPIRIGSGMRMKILDSIFSSSPIVTTSKGVEGLPLKNDEDCYVVDAPEDFAKAIKTLIDNPQKQLNFVKNSLVNFDKIFDTDKILCRRIDFYSQVVK